MSADPGMSDIELERRRFEQIHQQERAGLQAGGYSIKSLLEAKRGNAIVDQVFRLWTRGDFPSFELALIAMVVELAMHNDRLNKELVKFLERKPS